MVRRFYADVTQDDLLGPMFNEVARVHWSEHLPKLTAFWCRALLDQRATRATRSVPTCSSTCNASSPERISSAG